MRQAVQLALAPEQKARDAACRFKFTCEGFWQVEQFLSRATSKERRDFIRALKLGVMELSASRLHFTELLDQELLRRSLRPAVEFAKKEGIPLRMAMECDINGLSWGMADALAEAGVRWLSMLAPTRSRAHPAVGRLRLRSIWEPARLAA